MFKKYFYILSIVLFAGIMNASDTTVNPNQVTPKDNVVSIYPNPAKDYFYIGNLGSLKAKQVMVFNVVGNKVLDYTVKNNEGININRLPSGKYFVKIILSNNTQTMKHLIVQ